MVLGFDKTVFQVTFPKRGSENPLSPNWLMAGWPMMTGKAAASLLRSVCELTGYAVVSLSNGMEHHQQHGFMD